VGIGETYFPAFVLALSGSQVACGLVTTLPLVAGAVLQLVSPWGVARWRSYRRWIVFCVALQAATFVPLAIAAAMGRFPLLLVFAVVAVYWAAGLGSAGPWNAWMETLVPGRVRPRYFAWRTRVAQWGIVAGFLGGGIALQAAGCGCAGVFALLFLAAAASRLTSASLLASQREPVRPAVGGSRPPAYKLTGLLAGGVDGKLLLYLLAAQAGVQIAAPYFTPYMLGCLRFSYTVYAVVICVANVAKIVFLPALGRLIERVGVYRVFWLSAAAIVVVPGMWLVSCDFRYLIGVQVFSGVAWGANDLAVLLLFFETIPRDKRIDVLSVFNLANAIATSAGSLLGGALLLTLGTTGPVYLLLFALSAVARAAAMVLLARVPAAATSRVFGRLASTVGAAIPRRPAVPDRLPGPVYLQGPHWPHRAAPATSPLAAKEAHALTAVE
jgi:MFS family permease